MERRNFYKIIQLILIIGWYLNYWMGS